MINELHLPCGKCPFCQKWDSPEEPCDCYLWKVCPICDEWDTGDGCACSKKLEIQLDPDVEYSDVVDSIFSKEIVNNVWNFD